jgi:hypothetical protein
VRMTESGAEINFRNSSGRTKAAAPGLFSAGDGRIARQPRYVDCGIKRRDI